MNLRAQNRIMSECLSGNLHPQKHMWETHILLVWERLWRTAAQLKLCLVWFQDQRRAEKVSKRVNAIQEVKESVALLTQLLQDYDSSTASQSNDELIQVRWESHSYTAKLHLLQHTADLSAFACVDRISTSAVRRWDPHSSDWQATQKTTMKLWVSRTAQINKIYWLHCVMLSFQKRFLKCLTSVNASKNISG